MKSYYFGNVCFNRIEEDQMWFTSLESHPYENKENAINYIKQNCTHPTMQFDSGFIVEKWITDEKYQELIQQDEQNINNEGDK